MESNQETQETVDRFLSAKLHPKLLQSRKNQAVIQHKIDQYLQVQSFLALIEERQLDELETMIDLGSQFFVKAFVRDLKKTCLDIGFGFHVPLTSSEALGFLQEKIQLLSCKLDLYRQTEDSIKAHIGAIENELGKWKLMTEIEQAQSSGRII